MNPERGLQALLAQILGGDPEAQQALSGSHPDQRRIDAGRPPLALPPQAQNLPPTVIPPVRPQPLETPFPIGPGAIGGAPPRPPARVRVQDPRAGDFASYAQGMRKDYTARRIPLPRGLGAESAPAEQGYAGFAPPSGDAQTPAPFSNEDVEWQRAWERARAQRDAEGRAAEAISPEHRGYGLAQAIHRTKIDRPLRYRFSTFHPKR